MLTGQCLCGAVTFEVDAPDDHLGDVHYSYSEASRRANGSAFAASVPVPLDRYRLLSGSDVITEYESSPGNIRAFCSKCGSPVYGKRSSDPDHIRIRLGTMELKAKATLTAHVWTSQTPPWYKIEGYLKRFKEAADGEGGNPK